MRSDHQVKAGDGINVGQQRLQKWWSAAKDHLSQLNTLYRVLITHQLTLPSKLHLYKPAASQPQTFTFTIHSLKWKISPTRLNFNSNLLYTLRVSK